MAVDYTCSMLNVISQKYVISQKRKCKYCATLEVNRIEQVRIFLLVSCTGAIESVIFVWNTASRLTLELLKWSKWPIYNFLEWFLRLTTLRLSKIRTISVKCTNKSSRLLSYYKSFPIPCVLIALTRLLYLSNTR